MESTIGLYKTGLIKKAGPWKSLADVELATAEYWNGSTPGGSRYGPSRSSHQPGWTCSFSEPPPRLCRGGRARWWVPRWRDRPRDHEGDGALVQVVMEGRGRTRRGHQRRPDHGSPGH